MSSRLLISAILCTPWDREADTLIDYFKSINAAPSNAYARQINKSVKRRKRSGAWDRDYLYFDLSAESETQAFVNWKNPGTFTLTKAGSVTHTANRGCVTSGALADGLQSTFNPSTAGVGIDDLAVSIYSRTNMAGVGNSDWGTQSGALLGRIRIATNTGQFRLNMSAVSANPASVTDTSGWWSWLPNGANSRRVARNGVQQGGDIAVTSQAAPSSPLNFLNAAIGSHAGTTKSIALLRVSRGFTLEQDLAEYESDILPFLSWKGAAV